MLLLRLRLFSIPFVKVPAFDDDIDERSVSAETADRDVDGKHVTPTVATPTGRIRLAYRDPQLSVDDYLQVLQQLTSGRRSLLWAGLGPSSYPKPIRSVLAFSHKIPSHADTQTHNS